LLQSFHTVGGLAVTRYFFVLKGPDETHDDNAGTLLADNNAAIAYAHRIIRELKEAGGYDDSGRSVIVQNHNREVIRVIPF
jgi:hypothetical protein